MRLLLDSCVPRKLAKHINGHDVKTARDMDWPHLKDGDLLDAVADQFDVLVTVDKSLQLQQRIADRSFALVVLRAKSNRLSDLARLVPKLGSCLQNVEPGKVYVVEG